MIDVVMVGIIHGHVVKLRLAGYAFGSALAVGCLMPSAKAATNYSFTAEPITYLYCNNYAQGGKSCNQGLFEETIVFSNPFTFTLTENPANTFTITNVNETAVRTVEKTNTSNWSFTGGTYDQNTNILTFTGPNTTFGNGSNAISTPTSYSILLNFNLVDSGTTPTFGPNDYEFNSFTTVCVKWQDNGNTNCLPQDLVRIPSPVSALALFPLAFLGKLRNRYRLD